MDHILSRQTDFYRLAFSYVKNQDAAMDVVQEAIVKALEKVDTLREPAYLKTWFYRILINEAMNHFRRSRDLLPYDDALNDQPASALDPGHAWTSTTPSYVSPSRSRRW